MDFASIIIIAIRGSLAYIFLVNGWNKSQLICAFEKDVNNYELLPAFLVKPFSLILPFIEIGLGIMLILGWEAKIAAIFLSLLLMIFIWVCFK
jgi:uncharacterized membrane protein YphA (DoxX/SURF4 family)